MLLRKADVARRAAPQQHVRVWDSGQIGGLVAAASGWSGTAGAVDLALRLTVINPPPPETGPSGVTVPPRISQTVYELFGGFIAEQGDIPVGVLYTAVRAGRRAVLENPNDANAYLNLGRAYITLLSSSPEKSWAAQLSQLRRVRQLQASAALNRAVAINPRLAPAQLELSRLYLSLECLDLAVHHLRAYRELSPRWGGPLPEDPRTKTIDTELEQLTKELERQKREFVKESGQLAVSDRAMLAVRRGLVREARDLLLTSDVAAFGAQGTDLELGLLLHTGRPGEVLDWMVPELTGSLGDFTFHWLRAQAQSALGNYEAADAELVDLIGLVGGLPSASLLGSEVGGLVGKSLLDQQPGGFSIAQLISGALSRQDLAGRVLEITDGLKRQADVYVVRGLIALEAGNIDRAREAFREALQFSPNRSGGGQLDFNGRRVAQACVALIDQNPNLK